MTQFTKFVDLQLIEDRGVNKPEPIAKVVNLFDDMNWKRETMLGNDSMNSEQSFLAIQHYTSALKIARNLFKQYQHEGKRKIPDSVVPVIVVSYLNLADFWSDQGRYSSEKKCLIDAFDYLTEQLGRSDTPTILRNQILHGVGKIYTELTLCLRELGDFKTLELKKNILMNL